MSEDWPMRRKLGAAISTLALVSSLAWAGEVTVYEQAPSVEELQRQLMGGEAKKKIKTRSVIFGDAATAETEPPPAAAASAVAFPINFQVNSAEILPESVPFLEAIAGLLQKNPGLRLVIEGHTDKSGSPARNIELSRQRAFSVMNYLIDHFNVDPLRLVPVGKGYGEPLDGTEPTNPKNRRVQFRIVG